MVANATVSDLETLATFEDDERFEETDFRELAIAVHPNNIHDVTSFDDDFPIENHLVFTELGLCYVINAPIAVLLRKPYVQHKRCFLSNNHHICLIWAELYRIDKVTELGQPLTCNYQKNQCFLKVDIKHTAALVTHFVVSYLKWTP